LSQEAKTFLQRVLPWAPLGDPGAYFNIHFPTTKRDEKSGRHFFSGRAAHTVDKLVEELVNALRYKGNVGDMYFCMSSQRMADARTANGYSYVRAVKGQGTAVHLRSLVIDIDVKEDAYTSQHAAVAALKDFITASSMPKPTLIVSSGTGGLHVYWTLDTALTRDEWQPLADALAQATRTHGLMCDTQCTVDAARIMRVPGTFNHKTVPPSPVKLLGTPREGDYSPELLRQALAPYMGMTRPQGVASGTSALPARVGVTTANSELTAGLEREARPILLESVAESCGFIREALETGGAGFSNPLWNLTALISTFAPNGPEIIHAMSSGHAAYDENETSALYERKVKEREIKGLGWPACASIQNAGCTHCATCPHLAAGKSPLHLGRVSNMPAAAEHDLPQGYLRDPKTKQILRLQSDGTGSTFTAPLTRYPMYDAWIQREGWVLNFTTNDNNRELKIAVPSDVVGSRDMLAKTLNSQGFTVDADEVKLIGKFIVSWIQKLRESKSAVVSAAPFGWVIENGKTRGFAYGGRVWEAKGDSAAAQGDQLIALRYTPKGSLDVWKEAACIITDQQRPGLDIIIAMAFGAPLMRFTGESGAMLSAYSVGSGYGKSTAVKIGQAVWGSPKAAMTLDNTTNAVVGNLATLRNLPVYWDEVKSHDHQRFLNLIFQVAQGQGKARMRSDATLRDPGEWLTMMMVASNDSLVDAAVNNSKLSPAELYRIFEWRVEPKDLTGVVGDVSRLTRSLDENFGQAGLVYARFLGENADKVGVEVAELHNNLVKKLNHEQGERYWFAAITCLLAGAKYANELNLTQIDTKQLLRYCVDVLSQLRVEKRNFTGVDTELGAASILNRYLNERRARNMLVTDTMPLLAGRNRQPAKILNDVSRLDGLYVHVCQQQKVIRISINDLRGWLKDRQISASPVMEALKRDFDLRVQKLTLGAGTAYNVGAERCYELIVAGTSLEGWCKPEMGVDEEVKEEGASA
jgi:hypothetical protein